MKKTSNLISKMLLIVAFFGLAGTVSAQSVIAAGGSSSDDYSCVVGEYVAGDVTGFLASLYATDGDIATGIKSTISVKDVQIQSDGNGKVIVTLPDYLLAEGAYYGVYDASGALLAKADITDGKTFIDSAAVMNGKMVIVLVGTRKSGKLTSVKLKK